MGKIFYDLTPFIAHQRRFHAALLAHRAAESHLPIIEILTLLPISFRSNEDRAALLSRGNSKFDYDDGVYTNRSDSNTTVVFNDYILGQIVTDIPATVSFNVSKPDEIITLSVAGTPISISSIEHIADFGDPDLRGPFQLHEIRVGAESMLTRLSYPGGVIIIDGQIRSIARSVLAADEQCEKEWLLLQDKISRRCVVIHRSNPVRNKPTIGEYDSKEEAIRDSRNKGCNGVDV